MVGAGEAEAGAEEAPAAVDEDGCYAWVWVAFDPDHGGVRAESRGLDAGRRCRPLEVGESVLHESF
jgi:hypothetical protein